MLVNDDYERLRRYDPRRGSLWQFPAVVARGRLAVFCRAWERWTRHRVASDPDAVPGPEASPIPIEMLLEEFLSTLTPRERQYYDTDLGPGAGRAPSPFPPAYRAKLRERFFRKLRRYLEGSGD